MPSRDALKSSVCAAIDNHAQEIVRIAKTILRNPEPGFREVKTSRLVEDKFKELGIPYRSQISLTGVKAVLEGGGDGPCVAVLGELDSLIVREHPHTDPATGAAHACGHHAQIAMLLCAAYGLLAPDVLPSLRGRVALMAVPAEEYIEIEYRDDLREQGKLEFLGGKPEFIRLGAFDDVDMAIMCHTTSNPEDKKLALASTHNGTLAKRIQFIGKGAHAGSAPHLGTNALNAASLALMAIHANRETFREEDTIRVHPIITKGGEAVNAVPADVRMETFVRGKTIDAIMKANQKVDRALKAGAMAVGAKVRIKTIPGYLPLSQDENLARIFEANAVSLVGQENIAHVGHRAGSTDMGDLGHIMPVLHPYVGAATGLGHGADYIVEDYNLVITAGKGLACSLVDLLADGAQQARRVISQHKPAMTVEQYLKFMRSLAKDELFEP